LEYITPLLPTYAGFRLFFIAADPSFNRATCTAQMDSLWNPECR
jgi:hypothetical protein